MPPKLTTSPHEERADAVIPVRQPSCPCCAGHLIMLSGMLRCARCHYTLCVGCESVPTDDGQVD
jgi:hypothetical protein